MPSPNAPPAELYDHVVRAVLAYERDGELALARELASAGELAPLVREQIDSMRRAGLLQEPVLPERIGPWRVLQRLGSGGMGTVYLCDQEQPLHRRVAVKVMRAGADSTAVIARFGLERHALQALDHPGIARLLDAGTIDGGAPFLVMEYVAGIQLHRYCDERQLPLRARLDLFAKICDAVQHAHHKGIVHRDLKPSNVLVLDRDGAPWPMVIDFGVAKSIGTPSLGTILTLPGMMLGTPEYMSPEQATHELDVDTRADVYSLGVMLYELLTGTLPIERERLRSGDLARVLGTTEPPTPSSRITSLGDGAEPIAVCRDTDVAGLRRQVRGDLDWVVMKAIEKDRNRRYGMPTELAADVRRFLAREPVSAGPVSSWYRVQKWCARNRPQAIATSVALLTIVAALFTSTWFWRDAAASSRASAASLDDALTAVGELVAVGDSDLVDVPHLATVRAGLLDRSVAFYRGFLARADARDARVLPRIAEAQLRLGCMQVELGEHAAAAATLREGLARTMQLPRGAIAVPLHARSCDALAEATERSGDAKGALAAASDGEALLRSAFAGSPDDETRSWLVRTLLRRSRHTGRFDASNAHALAAEAAALAEPFRDGSPAHEHRVPIVLEAGAALAQRLLELGRRDDALRELGRAFATWQAAKATATEPGAAWRLTTAAGELADLYARCDDYGRMLELFAATEAAYMRLVADHPAVLPYRVELGRTRVNQANAQLRNYRFPEGLASVTAAEGDFVQAMAMAPDDATVLQAAARAAINVAQAHVELTRQGAGGDLELARAARERAAERIERLLATKHGTRSAKVLRLDERRTFAVLHAEPAGAEAREALHEAVQLADALIAADGDNRGVREEAVRLRIDHARALRRSGDAAGARAELLPVFDLLAALRDGMSSTQIWTLRRRALLLELAQAEATLGLADDAIARLRERIPLAENEDWGGKLEVVRLLLGFAKGPLAAHAPALLAFAREVVQLAHGAGDTYEARGTPNGSPAMVAAMRANTWALLVDVERLAGDARAEAAALGEVAACRAAACSAGASERGREQVRSACEAWLDRLLAVGDTNALAAAGDRIATWSADDAEALLAAAKALGGFVGAHPEATAVLTAGRRLVALAIAAGGDAERFRADADLRRLQD